jgi:hypothetical protein
VWAARVREFGQDGGTARGSADKTVGTRVFNEAKRRFICRTIVVLDRQVAANP